MRKENLWIFLHLPKTGGTTFSKHIKKNLKKEEVFDMSDLRYGFESFDIEEQKKARVILGHATYYGIHKFFPEKIPRYIIFLRDPAERIASTYNFEMRVKQGKNISFWDWYSAQPKNDMTLFLDMKYRGKEGTKANIPDVFLKTFYKIFSSKKITYFFQSAFEKYYSIFMSSDKKMLVKFENSKKLLKNCWYIGIMPGLNKDLKFLFKEIHVPMRWKNENLTSKKKAFFKLDEETRRKIYQDNKYDKELFDYALFLKNQNRKNKNSEVGGVKNKNE